MRFAALLIALALTSASAAPTAFTLAVLRRDGILIPFAAFDGRAWETPWPASDSGVVLPIALADVPKKWWGPAGLAAPWTAWMAADGAARPLTVVKPAQARVFCGTRIALATDYHGPEVNPREPTIAKDALAIAAEPGTVALQPIIDVSVHAPDAARIVGAITDEFNAEEKIAAHQFTNWMHPYSAEERAAYRIELEAFYRSREKTKDRGEWLANYVEAVRRFPAEDRDQGCGLITWVRGWVFELPGKKPDVHLAATVTYCDREGVSFMMPFGRLTLDNETYWIYQMSSWRDEMYTVTRVRPDGARPVVAVVGGGCPRDTIRR
jgi:hypothetical protein